MKDLDRHFEIIAFTSERRLTGAQLFEATGLSKEVIDEYFVGTTSRLGGVGIEIIAQETIKRHHVAYPPGGEIPGAKKLQIGGEYQWRRDGEPHLFDPETVFTLQHATRSKRFDIFKRYTTRVDEQSRRLMTLRGLFKFKEGHRKPIPIEQVEPISEILKRFATGASESSFFTSPFGRPKWAQMTIPQPAESSELIVGSEAFIRPSSVIRSPSSGTFKSHLRKTRFPAT